MAGIYLRTADLPLVIPVFPLDGALLLPRGNLPLNIFEPRYLNMIDDVMAGDRIVGMIQTRDGDRRTRPALADVGCAGRVTSYAETGDGRYLITLTGICRFRIGPELAVQAPYRQLRVDYSEFEDDLKAPEEPAAFNRDALLKALKAYLERRGLDIDWRTAEDAPVESLVNSLSMALPFETAEKQALLEAETPDRRRATLTALLQIDAAADDDTSSQIQ
jgi:Lon protease-like protein